MRQRFFSRLPTVNLNVALSVGLNCLSWCFFNVSRGVSEVGPYLFFPMFNFIPGSFLNTASLSEFPLLQLGERRLMSEETRNKIVLTATNFVLLAYVGISEPARWNLNTKNEETTNILAVMGGWIMLVNWAIEPFLEEEFIENRNLREVIGFWRGR